MYYTPLIVLLLKSLFFNEPQTAAGGGAYTKCSTSTCESMILHPDSTYRYSFHGCLSVLIDSGTYSYRHGAIRLSSFYKAMKDSLPFRRVVRSWHNQELWLCGDKLFYKKTSRGYDLQSFWIRDATSYRYTYNKKIHPIEAGVIQNHQLISGLEYVYDANESLVEVKFIEHGAVVKDSLLR